MAPNSLFELFLQNVNRTGDATAALEKRDGRYEPVTWNEMWEQARPVAEGVIGLGLDVGDRVAIIAHTSLQWVTTDLAVGAAGGVVVPIYPSNLPSECQYVVENADAKFVFTQDAEQSAKFVEERAKLPNLRHVIQLNGEAPSSDGWVITLDELRAKAADGAGKWEDRRQEISRDSIQTLIYTSGTTGRPKGVVLTQNAFLYTGAKVVEIGLINRSDTQLLFLPLAHVFAKCLLASWYHCGHVMAFAENMTTIKQNLGETSPTVMCGVPRVYEKFYTAVVEKAGSAGGLKAKLFQAAMDLSQKNGEAEERGESLGLADQIKFGLLKKVIFSKIRAGVMTTLGGRMRLMVSGGAPLAKKIAWFFRDAEITVCEGYGLTESTGATCCNLPESNRIGTVGPAMPGTQLKIAEDGEILMKGDGIMTHYWQNEEATAATLIDGWLHTGDIGEIDARTGALRITDRKKDIIVTAGGKNVAPQKIENLLKTHKLISQAVVHGDRRKFVSALITVDELQLETWAQGQGLSGEYCDLCQNPKLRSEIEKLVEQSNSELASYESVKKFKILEQDFSIETGELTPKLSVKRKVVNSKYGHVFDEFYAEDF